MSARPGSLGVVAATVTCAFVTAVGFASHSYAATYTGTIASGGSVQLDVTADGNSVTRFQADPGLTDCGLVPLVVAASPDVIPIVNHAFSYKASSWSFSGSFPTAQSAQGTMQYRRETFPACTLSPRDWSAT